MIKSGLAFHCHHDTLVEYVHDYDERVNYIKKRKPKKEQALRLKLFRLIPEDRVPQELIEVGKAYDKAWEAWDKAWEAWDKAGEAFDKARKAYDKAAKNQQEELELLHTELCPDCPWDGETIFGR